MPKYDFSTIEATATGETVAVRLAPISASLLSAALTDMAMRYTWSPVDDSTWDNIEAAVAQAQYEVWSNVLIGTIVWRAGSPQTNELLCDGATYNRVDYPGLYAALDLAYIIDADSFRVPDLAAAYVRGPAVGEPVGSRGGSNEHTLITEEMPPHNHGYTPPIPNVDIEAPGVPDILAAGVGPVTSTGSTGGGQPHNNQPLFEVLNPCLIAR